MPKVSPKTKILFCMNHIIMGGLEKVLCQYLLALKTIPNIEVSVVSREKVTEPYFIEFFKENKIELIDNFIVFKKKKLGFIKLGDDKRKAINNIFNTLKWRKLSFSKDIFIDFANFSCFQEFSKIKKPKIGWIHGSILFFQTLLDSKKNTSYDKLVCLSESFRDDFVSKYPELAEKIDFIYNPINVEETYRLAAQKVGVEVNSSYFVAVQRLDNGDKDVATVIKAFHRYSQIDKDTKLYIIGDGPNRKELEQLAQDNKNIIFTGQLDNPYPLIKNAKALILSSTKKIGEGLPNTLLEAQALGTLAISSDVKSGVREILLDETAGLLFEAENPESLAEKLVYVKEHTDECRQMVQTATENLNRFSVENAVKKFLEMCCVKKDTY